MKSWLRILMVWLMAIAFPLQGVAGLTMAHCDSSHARMASATESTLHRHADHDASAAHGSDAVSDVVVDATHADHGPDRAAKSQPGQSSDLAQYKCSSCASCCTGIALPTAVLRMPEATPAPAVFAEVMVTVDAFSSDGPDRPPRIDLV